MGRPAASTSLLTDSSWGQAQLLVTQGTWGVDGVGESSSRRGFKVEPTLEAPGQKSDFQGSYASHEGGRKLLAREQLSGKEKKDHKFCCYCWLGPALCQSLESCTDPLSRKSFL